MATTGNHSTPATAPVALYTLISHLATVGAAAKVADSDGSTYSSAGTRITSGASGAQGLANSLAWFILREVGATREWCYQRSSANNTDWRVKISPSGFSAGSPSATQTPSATDEQIVWGGGTDASPTFAALFLADGGYRWQVGAEATTKAWVANAFPTGGGACRTLLYHDVLAAGTYPSEDTQPVVYRCHYHAALPAIDFGSGTYLGNGGSTFVSGAPVKRIQHGGGSAAWRPVAMATYLVPGASNLNAAGTEPYGNRETPLALHYARTTAPQTGVHGASSLFWHGTTTTSRSTGDILVIGSNRWARVDQAYVEWDTTAITQ